MSHDKATTFSRLNKWGISRIEQAKLVDDVAIWLEQVCAPNKAKRITVQISAELKGDEEGTDA